MAFMSSRLTGVGTECRDGPPVVVAAPGWECRVCSGRDQAYDGSCHDCNRRLARRKARELVKTGWKPKMWREVSEEEEDATLISILGLTSHVRNLMGDAG